MAHNAVAVKKSDILEISKNDPRSYRYLVLPNGLRVVLVSDPKADKAAAALSVSVGSFSDPEEIPGLAHFLEHMLFLGSEKYPGENDYSEYLSENGGYSNAYTAAEETNYHFEVAPAGLEKALDMFSGFFTCPLFTEGSTARELKAVDAEHAKNIQNDMWRLYQLDKSTGNPGHPYSKFGTGDSRTLQDIPLAKGINVRENLLSFHKLHYSANRMTLSILGVESLDTLGKWAHDRFATICNNGSAVPAVHGHPHQGQGAILHFVVPVKDLRSITISWAFPEQQTKYLSKPAQYLSHLIGHEGPGSVLELLKAQGWATGLSAGPESTSGFANFQVSIDLSPEGLDHVADVQVALYAYIGMLEAAGPQQWVYDESAAQSAASFRFKNVARPIGAVTGIVRDLHQFPAEHVLSGHSLFWFFKPEEVSELMDLFVPSNSRVTVVSQSFADRCSKEEQWYGTKYAEEAINSSLVQLCLKAKQAYKQHATERGATRTADSVIRDAEARPFSTESLQVSSSTWAESVIPALALPAPNEFIATDFTLRDPVLHAKQAEAEASGKAFGAAEDDERDDEDSAAPNGPAADLIADPYARVPTRRDVVPVLLQDDSQRMVWWHLDDNFAVPKVYLHAEIQLPAAYASPKAFVLTDLFVKILEQSLTDFAYAAQLAGLSYRLNATVEGFQLQVGGFSHKAHILARKVAERVATLPIDEVMFNIQKDAIIRSYVDFNMEQPIHHAMYGATMCTTAPRWHNDDKIEASKTISIEDLRVFRHLLLDQAFFLCSVCGNADKAEAIALVDAIVQPLTKSTVPSRAQQPVTRIARLPSPIVLSSSISVAMEWHYEQANRNAEDPNAAMMYFLQLGPIGFQANIRNTAMGAFVANLVSEPFFDSLRTKQSLGYVVQASHVRERGVHGIRFLIQSNKVDAPELVARTNNFICRFYEKLATMPADKFAAHVIGFITKANESDKNLSEEASYLFAQVQLGWFDFRRTKRVTDAIKSFTQAEVVQWYQDHVAPWGSQRRALISTIRFSPTAERPTDQVLPDTADPEVIEPPSTISPTSFDAKSPIPGQPAPTGSVPAPEDALAPRPQLPGILSPVARKIPIVGTICMSAAQALVIANGLEASDVRAGDDARVFSVFASTGVDLEGIIKASATAPAPSAVRCVVQVEDHDAIRFGLPAYGSAAIANYSALRAQLIEYGRP